MVKFSKSKQKASSLKEKKSKTRFKQKLLN